MPKERWPDNPEALSHLEKFWEEPYGDRRQEIVFIGADMDREGLTAALDDALIDERCIYEPEDWVGAPDPFPNWRRTNETIQ